MKRKLKRILLGMMLGLMLPVVMAGCGKKAAEEKKEAPATETAAGADAAEKKSADLPDSGKLYEAFLTGEEGVYFDNYDINGYDYENDKTFPIFEKDRSYSIGEVLEKFCEMASSSYLDGAVVGAVDCAELDLGLDGEPELGLSVRTDSILGEPLTYELVIKNIDGKLQAVYHTESYYRMMESLETSYGLVSFYVSYSYNEGFDSLTYIDAEGNAHNIYDCSYSYSYGISFLIDSLDIWDKVHEAGLTAEDVDERFSDVEYNFYSFDHNEEGFESTEGEYEYYKKGCFVLNADEGTIAEAKELFETLGFRIVEDEYVTEQIDKMKKQAGVPDAADEKSSVVEWKPVENDIIGEILAYGINPVYVKNAEELINSIKPNASIVIDTDTINITKYLVDNRDKLPEYQYYDGDGQNEPGVYCREIFDGLELVVVGIDGLKLISKDEKNMACIVCEPRYAQVISFESCIGLKLRNLYMGHTPEQGYCSGAVLELNYCDNVDITGCDLYGCGTYGITAYDCNTINTEKTRIHDCSYGVVDMARVGMVSFTDCIFEDCEEFVMFELPGTTSSFYDCTFRNLAGEIIYMGESDEAYFYNCTFDKSTLDGLTNYSGPGRVVIN